MWAILMHGERGEAYDVGGDKPITMMELAQAFVKVFGTGSPIEVQNGIDPMPIYLPPNTAKTKRLLSE
jgi:nucleoside-diphosphate-sugar epimerase